MSKRLPLRTTILSASALGLILSSGAIAQSSDPIDDILVCQRIAEESARLACFDAAAGRLTEERENGLVAIYRQDVEAVERDSFGFDLPSMPRLSLSMFGNGGGNSPDPLDPASTPERLAAAEAGEPVRTAPTQSDPDPVQPSADESGDDSSSRGLFARLTGRGGEESSPPPAATQGEPVNGVQVVERDDEGGVERVVMQIERVRSMGYNRNRFYMTNGQVWDQSAASRISYDEDETNFAEIRRASLDSYLMQINGRGRAIRVHRHR
ncbi:hypothetical protein [Hyphobacterium sp.]|uniref:hypothetical protein n=1 Tax=Hyphobacterium sp. TaxID=2004662 RepID=UPI003748DBC5